MIFFFALALAALLVGGTYLFLRGSWSAVSSNANPGLKTQPLAIVGAKLSVEVAVTGAEQGQGLSDRPSLAPDAGMLFPFSPPARPPFWMLRMHFPLDFIYLNGGRVVELKANVSHTSLKPFAPQQPVDAVLEVNAGYIASHGIKVGDAADY